MSNQFHALKVAKKQQETNDTVSISFHVPTELKETFKYKQGQYLTLQFTINGNEERLWRNAPVFSLILLKPMV